MSLSHALATPVDEIMESSALAPRINGFHLEPRCRVCRNDVLRKKVNDMLATGASYAMIVRALSADNTKLAKCDRVTIDSVRTHATKHFRCRASPKPLTAKSSNAGHTRTASTSSKASPRRSHHWRSTRSR